MGTITAIRAFEADDFQPGDAALLVHDTRAPRPYPQYTLTTGRRRPQDYAGGATVRPVGFCRIVESDGYYFTVEQDPSLTQADVDTTHEALNERVRRAAV